MTWEETIESIRNKPEFSELVKNAYFDSDLQLNVERFKKSAEFKETLNLIKKYVSKGQSILDIGSGNGISAVAFALEGYDVVSIEPDPSSTVGAGAIELLKLHLNLTNLTVIEKYAEDIDLPDTSFDIVYFRQAMHHANNLSQFVANASRLLKKGGVLFSIRDHVIYNEDDKKWFLESHPLHKYYGGENAFTSREYETAFDKAGLEIIQKLKYYDSIINYFPSREQSPKELKQKHIEDLKMNLRSKIGLLALLPFAFSLYLWLKNYSLSNVNWEASIPGRMYSYVCRKQ